MRLPGLKFRQFVGFAVAVACAAAATVGARSYRSCRACRGAAGDRPALSSVPAASSAKLTDPGRAPIGGKSRLPLYFERNAGQTSGDVRFLAHGPGYALLLTETGAVIRMSQPAGEAPATRWNRAIQTARIRARRHAPHAGRSATVRIAFAGARPSAPIEGLGPLAGRVNYFLGNNPTTWHRSIATSARVRSR